MIRWWRSIALKFVGLFTLVTAVASLGGLFWLIEREKASIEEKFGLALRSAAATAAPFIRGEDLDAIHTDQDATTAEFIRVRTLLETVRRQNNLREDQVYILREGKEGSDRYEFVVMLQQQTFIGDKYWPPPQVAARYRQLLNERAAQSTPLFSDDHGTFISGMAPVQRADGTPAGILQVDYGVDLYLAEVAQERNVLLTGVLLFLMGLLAFGEWLRRWLHRNVEELLKGTRAIEQENYDYTVNLPTQDELNMLADALNHAMGRLKERFEMLKFLPRHTSRMIEKAVRGDGVRLSNANRVKVTVLNSDIRGFTRMSELLPPEKVIAILNEYVRVQAELVEAAGGSIDKYMGDAVLAIFEGEDANRHALEASMRIQEAVARMNADGIVDAPVLVGIGLSVGDVVMGNMGSHQRMEYTVIGSPVNLASRLCGIAGPGEIVLSSELEQEARGVDGISVGSPEELPIKGFEQKVKVFRATAARAASTTRPAAW